jgi:hypothetical protein
MVVAGIYTFQLTTDGVTSPVVARYSYVYKKQADGAFKILCHHSSAMPEKTPVRRLALENGACACRLDSLFSACQGRPLPLHPS